MIKIADDISDLAFNEEGIAGIEAGGRSLCIIKKGDDFFACAAKCPHAGHPLAGGYVDSKGNIVCPLHSYKFSLLTGRNVTGEGYDLKLYPLCIEQDGVYVSL